MIITVQRHADPSLVRKQLIELGLWVKRFDDSGAVRFLVEPHSARVTREQLLGVAGVGEVAVPRSSTPLLDAHPATLRIGTVEIGASAKPVLMAGPCSVESEAAVTELARKVAACGATFLRGGAFKPRTSPYDFQGHGKAALGWMRRAADDNGLLVVTEAMAPAEVELVAQYADLLQVGSRNMQSSPLLRAAGASGRPILLKRGMASTMDEWLAAAEYLLLHGAAGVVLCERGIRSFDTFTRFSLDLAAVAYLTHVRRLPVVVDPSHGAGRRDLIASLSRASIAVGAAGLMVETHEQPGEALSDGPQALPIAVLDDLGRELFSHARAQTPAVSGRVSACGSELS